MSPSDRGMRAAIVLVAALAALVFAATAAAETRAGESTTVATEETPTPGATIVKASASYETGGKGIFTLTTAGPPSAESHGELWGALSKSSPCALPEEKPAAAIELLLFGKTTPLPVVVLSKMTTPEVKAIRGNISQVERVTSTKSVTGTTTTLTVSGSNIADTEYNCAFIEASDGEEFSVGEGEGSTAVAIPLVALPEPPPPTGTGGGSSPVSQPPAPAAAPAPTALSIGKSKPVTLKAGKWQAVKIKVTNTGAGTSAAGSLRLRTPKGVLVKPEQQQVPILAPGKSWSVSFRVQLTAKAKPKSTVALIATASGVTATGALTLKLKK